MPAEPLDPINAFVFAGAWLPVSSSNVVAAQYSGSTQTLTVEFKGNKYYQYNNVNRMEAYQFATAGSKGRWVWDNLRVRGSKELHQKPYVKLF